MSYFRLRSCFSFSKEFYETFFHLSKQDSLNWYNEAFQKGSLSVSQTRGVISLIPLK